MARDSAAPASAKGRGAPPEARRSLVAPGSRGARPPRPALRPWPAWVDAVRVARGYVQGGVLSGDVIWGPAAGLGRRSSGPEPGLPQGGACGAGAIWGGTGAGRAHVVQERQEPGPQLRGQEPHRWPRPQQESPQGAQCGTHEARVTIAQGAQECGQQRAPVPHLRGQGLVGGPSQASGPPRPALTFFLLSAMWPRPSRPSQRVAGSGSLCQARSRSRMTSSRRSPAVGRLCNS